MTRNYDDNSGLIYHYTSPAGLLGILETRSIWLSDTQFLNDLSEVRYAAELVCKQLEDVDQELMERIERNYLGDDLNLPLETFPYVASFCKSDDLLSMWRSYGADGVSIGFDRACLDRLLSNSGEEWGSLSPEEIGKMRHAHFGIAGQLVDIEYLDKWTINDKVVQEIRESDGKLSGFLAGIKNPAFREEREVRIIAFANSCTTPPQIRENNGRIVPYRPLVFPFEAIRSITVGPGSLQSSNARAIRRYFEKQPSSRGEWAHVIVRESSTPYFQL